MPRKCTVCHHKDREKIEQAYLDGVTYRNIARIHGVTIDSLKWHILHDHIDERLVRAKQAKEVAQADTLLDQIIHLKKKGMDTIDAAEKAGDLRAVCSAIREVRGILDLIARVTGELKDTQVNVTINDTRILQYNAVIMEVLCEDCRNALSRRLEEMGILLVC